MISSLSEAQRIVGGTSTTSKMPGRSLSLPAKFCNVGSKLRLIEGTPCSVCYAFDGWYATRPTIAENQMDRLEAIYKGPQWVEAMVYIIRWFKESFFRWHDTGDLMGTWHLAQICQVCEQTPDTMHWLPTQEWAVV